MKWTRRTAIFFETSTRAEFTLPLARGSLPFLVLRLQRGVRPTNSLRFVRRSGRGCAAFDRGTTRNRGGSMNNVRFFAIEKVGLFAPNGRDRPTSARRFVRRNVPPSIGARNPNQGAA
jgi:hypothetical protein